MVQLIPLVLLSIIAWWRNQPVLFILSGALSLVTGLWWRSQYDSSLGMATALSLIAYWLLCWGMALRYLMRSGERTQ